MANVVGPASSLPGSAHALPKNTPCDEHPDRAAVSRVQGETDSIGAEFHDLCAECLTAYRADLRADRVGRCDWCKSDADDLFWTRDYEEGLAGPVYQVCGACREARNERIQAEMDDSDDW